MSKKFYSDGLEPELERVMFNIIENARKAACADGSDILLKLFGPESATKRPRPDLAIWMRAPAPCFICGRTLDNYMPDWYADAHGNIVHNKCYKS